MTTPLSEENVNPMHQVSKRTKSCAPAPKTVGFWLLCLIVPIAMLCAAAAATGVYPFGEMSFLTEDLKYQYIDFYRWYRRVLCGQESVFYSTACGLGANTWGLYSYYLASPINFLMLLFDEAHITLFVFAADAIRLALMQLSAVFYLRRRFGLRRAPSFTLALGYTWSLWVATNLRNPMWLDALVLLPLIMWAVWRLVDRGRWLPLALLTTANIVVCWYTAYMTVLFCIMLALLERACAGGRRPVWRLALDFARPMAAALLLSAWTFLPTVKAMLGSGGSEEPGLVDLVKQIFTAGSPMGVIRAVFTTQPVYMLRGLVPALYDPTHRIPQFYCGVLLLVCLVAFFASRRVDGRVKRAAGVFVVVMLASVVFRPLQAIWCGFREPSGFYSRPCLFVGPTLMWIAGFWAGALRGEKGLAGERLAAGPSGATGAVGATEVVASNGLLAEGADTLSAPDGVPAAPAATLARLDAAALLVAGKNGRVALVAALAAAELTLGACFAFRSLYTGYTQEQNDTYYEQSTDQVSWLKSTDTGTWRMERTSTRAGLAALNEAMGCDYVGISSYSSAHNQSALDFLDKLGYSKEGLLHVRYAHSVLAADALLGVKYTSSGYPSAGMSEVAGAPALGGDSVYENPYALSLGYVVADSAVGTTIDGENPFERQNSFASALAGHEVELYKRADATQTQDEDGRKTWQVSVPAGTLGYVYVDDISARESGVDLIVDGSSPEREGWRFQYCVRPFGSVEGEAGGTHTVTVTTAADAGSGGASNETQVTDLAAIHCDFYYLDLDALQAVADELSAHQLSFSSFSGKGIDATVETGADGWAMVSVPHEDGWTVTVNGQEVQTSQAFGDALTLVPVTAGKNTIRMRFVSPGFYAGCAVSAASAAGLLVWGAVRRRRRTRGEARFAASGAAEG